VWTGMDMDALALGDGRRRASLFQDRPSKTPSFDADLIPHAQS